MTDTEHVYWKASYGDTAKSASYGWIRGNDRKVAFEWDFTSLKIRHGSIILQYITKYEDLLKESDISSISDLCEKIVVSGAYDSLVKEYQVKYVLQL